MKFKIYDRYGREIKKEVKEVYVKEIPINNKNFEHYMIKEIHEEKIYSSILINSLEHEQTSQLDKFLKDIENSGKVIFLAAGSSYHSSLIASYLLRKLGIESYAVIASEYDNQTIYNKDTLVVAVSQSGETMDVILAIKNLKNKVKKIVSIVNVPYSTVQRISDYSLEIRAGFEKAVAATKTYINQLILFYYVAKKLGLKVDINEIPKRIEYTIDKNEDLIKDIAKKYIKENDIYIIGRGINYYASLEIALKLKEISYIHAEALAAGELKHGTLALIERGTKVIALNPYFDEKIKTNIEEVEARGGEVLDIPNNFNFPEYDLDFPIYSVIIGQLLTYYIAKFKNLPIDKPRNLAKSVTVI